MALPYEIYTIASSKGVIPLGSWGEALVTFFGSLFLIEVLYRFFRWLSRHAPAVHLLRLVARSKNALRALAVSIAGAECVRFVSLRFRPDFKEIAELAIIFSVAWIAIISSAIFADLMTGRFDVSVADNRRARRAHTQLQVMRRVMIVFIVAVAGLAGLTSSSSGRAIAASVLASAGILGLVAGIAGQSTLGNLIAGVQIAFSDALRIDDVVVINGDWGTIEEITLTFVVVAIWDERRLVLPVSYFVSTPFENWTRTNADILGTVLLYVDHTVPVDEVRHVLLEYVKENPLWDRRVVTLQVVDTTEHAIQLRALVSAASASRAWDLRCAVREYLIAYLRDRRPSALPRTRVEMPPSPTNISTI